MRTSAVGSVTVAVWLFANCPPAHARETAAVDDDAAFAQEDMEDADFGPRSNVRTRAEHVSFDARLRTLELGGNVRVDAPPFHLRSEHLRLTRTRLGIEVDGDGTLAFCPCLGTPLTVDFDRALVAPPGDLILKNPTLRVYGLPVLPLPYFWLRSDDRPGLLPPDIAYRGSDGFFTGGGVHLPWFDRGDKSVLDLRAGAYILRGFAGEARLKTAATTTKVRYDRLPSERGDDGLMVDARGAFIAEEAALSWDADMLRGHRGIFATTELDAAARPWDRASVETALRSDSLVFATNMRAVSRRGGGLFDADAIGPVVTLRSSGAVHPAMTYDVTVEGGSLQRTDAATRPDVLSFARAEVGMRAAHVLGPLESSLALRGAANVAASATDRGDDRASSARGRLAMPFSRAFDTASDPWRHIVEPFVEVAALYAGGDGLFGVSPARGASAVRGAVPLAEGGLTTSLGRWGTRQAIDLVVATGAALTDETRHASPLARAKLAASVAWLSVSADAASVLEDSAQEIGTAAIARARVGPSDGVRVLANVATREGVDPVLARALFDAPLEPAAGFLVRTGTTAGAGLVIPWSTSITTSSGADVDATQRELVGARAGIELRDRCGCLTLRATGSRRIGRDGVDVWLALDFAADR